jgi:hypothetical protein
MRRLSEDGIVVLGDEGEQMNDMFHRAEEWYDQLRRQRLQEEMQQTWLAVKRAAASASARTGVAPGAGEAASAGAGEAALASSQSRSRSRSPSSSIPVQADGPCQRSRRHRRRSTPRQLEPASSSRTPNPEVGAATRAAEAVPLPHTPTATSFLQPKCKARAGASSKIEPMRTPVRDVPPDSQGGAWVRVADGWLTRRALPDSNEKLKSWGADVVVSLQSTAEEDGIAHGILAAGASAHALAYSYVCQVGQVASTWKANCYSDADCKHLARAVAVIDAHLRRGHKVAVLCRHGLVAILYVVLRLNGKTSEDSVFMMNTMRLNLRGRKLRVSDLVQTAALVLANPAFIWEYAYELADFRI